MKNNEIYEFDRFRLEAEKPVLWFADEIVPLKPKALETLVVLVRRGGEVVTKDELMEGVWANSFVEESNLSRNVSELRKTLNEFGGKKFIETVPRRGYRFAGEVNEVENGNGEITIERQVFEQTLVEEITDEKSFSLSKTGNTKSTEEKKLPAPISSRVRPAIFVATIILLIMLAAGFAVWRYQNSQAETASLPEIESIAVLPFKSFSSESVDKSLRLRITDALITRLGSLNKIAVRPTNSVLAFDAEAQDAVEAGRKLGVDAVLDGRVQEENDHLRVTLQLVSINTGKQLWSEQFDGHAGEILDLQDMIANRLRQKFAFAEAEKHDRRPTENSEAYEAYLLGRYFWNQRSPASLERGIKYFRQATEKDPSFTLAYVGLAESYVLKTVYCGTPPTESYPLARRAALKVLELDKDNAAAYTVLAKINWQHDYDVESAEWRFRQALKLDPNNVSARHWYGEFLGFQKRFEEAIAELEKAQKLDPLSLIIRTDLAMVYFSARQFDRAESELRKVLEMDSNFPVARAFLAKTLAQIGRKTEAIDEMQAVIEQYGDVGIWVGSLATIYAADGQKNNALQTLENLKSLSKEQYTPSYFAAVTYSLLGEKNQALEMLDQSFKERDWMLIYLLADPRVDNLRDDERFKKILRQINFENRLID